MDKIVVVYCNGKFDRRRPPTLQKWGISQQQFEQTVDHFNSIISAKTGQLIKRLLVALAVASTTFLITLCLCMAIAFHVFSLWVVYLITLFGIACAVALGLSFKLAFQVSRNNSAVVGEANKEAPFISDNVEVVMNESSNGVYELVFRRTDQKDSCSIK